MQSAPPVETAIEHQRQHGQTAAQFQHTNPGDFIRAANASARASLQRSRDRAARGIAADQVERADLAGVHSQHVANAREAMTAPITRAVNRVANVHGGIRQHVDDIVGAVLAELTLEFWQMREEVDELLSQRPASTIGADNGVTLGTGGIVGGMGTLTGSGYTMATTGTVGATGATGAAATPPGPTGATGTVDQASTESTSGTVASTGTVENAGTAGA
jgi:hypothetical protein